jgi:proline iminopeptidase
MAGSSCLSIYAVAASPTGDPTVLTFDQVAADFEAIRVDLGVDKVAIIGHSILGVLAIEYGRRCPATVSHVMTVGTPPRGDMAWLWGVATQFFEQDASQERKGVLRDNLAQFPPGTSFEQSFPAQAPLRFYDAWTDMMPLYQDTVVKPELLGHLLGPLTKDWDVTRDPSSLRVPIFLTHGRYDYTVPYTLWDGIEAVLPMATRRVFSRSGHQPFFEEPDEFAMVVAEWMKKQHDARAV